MTLPPTHLARFPEVYIVEASAGSGKTYTLAKRYVSLLINPFLKPEEIPLNTILAITFTNKAALEMKERILEFLRKISLNKFASREERQDILSALGVNEKFAQEKAHRIMDYLIRNYNFFQVQTIDSFINTILYGCAFKLDLSASFKTQKNYLDYLVYSFDRLIDKASFDKNVLEIFEGFLKQYLYIEYKGSWFPRQSLLSTITSLFAKSNRYRGSLTRNRIEVKDLIRHKKNILKLIQELTANLPPGTHKTFIQNLSSFLKENSEGFALDSLSDFFKREDFPVNKGHSVFPQTKRLWNKIRKNIRELCELESSSIFNYYIDIFNHIILELRNITKKDNLLFLEALNKEASFLFEEKLLDLPELYYRLASRFKHFLIDEFQDTSWLQWENLFSLVEEALSTDGSLFYVGDKKQAIYRFRGGDVSLIDRVRQRFSRFNLIFQSLNKNYRSQKEIVEFNNWVFSPDNLSRFLEQREKLQKTTLGFSPSDMAEIVNIFQGARQSYRKEKSAGYVKVVSIDYKDTDQQNQVLRDKLIELVKDLNERFSLKDICLLARKNTQVEQLTSWFLEGGIPVESEKTLNIRENSYIKELVSFLKFLNSPIDNLSFASFILGEIFCRASGLSCQEIQDFIFGLKDKEKGYLYREFREKFPRIWVNLIEEFFKNVGLVGLYELVISIFTKFEIMQKFSNYQGFFMKFLELIKEQDQTHTGLASFLDYFEQAPADELYVNVTGTNSLKILTIHKSKGLEFPVVIVPFLEMEVKIDSELFLADNNMLKLIYLKKKYADFSPILANLLKEEYKKSFIDELNSIYVAFTRAIDELYIFVSPKTRKGLNLASLLIPDKNLEQGRRGQIRDKVNRESVPTIELPPSEYKDWLPLLKDEFIEESILQEREDVRKGKLLHYILSFIGNLYNQERALVVKQAIDKAGRQFPGFADWQDWEFTVNKLLSNRNLRPYFEVEAGEIFKELEIVDSRGNTKRIDRLIVKPGEVWVIDYKTAKGSGSDYYDQMAEYISIIQDIYPHLVVKGFLIYLADLTVERV